MQRLKTMLNSIDHKGYPAYKGLKGSYDFGDYRLGIDKVQGDPLLRPLGFLWWCRRAHMRF